MMVKHTFVAREQELLQLDGYLTQVLAGQGMVCFITGEAGSGKTTLVSEFARRAQELNTELAVAVGQSDAQTGISDAYLPFRELLGQLTGDVDAKLAQGAITEENASRLRKLLVLSGQALVEVGPDLIGIFVPGAGLATRLGAFVAEKAGWMARFEKLVGKPKDLTAPGASGVQPSHIFEQYANVICKLSEKQPLLLVLDDLQWADAASLGLLFRLGRRIASHRVLLVGTYRPEEVAIGRAGERHPLEKVLAEFKRYYGDIWVDLDQVGEHEKQHFVDAFLNTEPNQLEEGFRQKLYQHTGGHALFTIELLRNMQERGELVQDVHGRWIETAMLDWESLPTRVEGVIEERIGRLAHELRQMLTVGSVQGEDFTAEVVARVQAVEAGGLIRRLSGELERQHRLVMGRGVRRLEPAGQRLSLYRFQHNLFQKYLYNELGEAERAYLHEDVGEALEALYGVQTDEIAVQLVRHFEVAGITEKARLYLRLAGEQAAARYANDEAIAYFTRALELTPDSDHEARYALLMDRLGVYNIQGDRELEAKDLAFLDAETRSLGDDRKQIMLTLRQVIYDTATSNFPAAITAVQRVLSLAETLNEGPFQAQGHYEWGVAAWCMGDFETALYQLGLALTLARKADLREMESMCISALGKVNARKGDLETCKTYFEQSLQISRQIGNRRSESKALNNLGVISNEIGNQTNAREYYEQALVICYETGEQMVAARILNNLGVVSEECGNLIEAIEYSERACTSCQEVGDRDLECIVLGNLGLYSGLLGDYAQAMRFYDQAVALSQGIGSQPAEITNLIGLGRTFAWQGNYTSALENCSHALHMTRKINYRGGEIEALRTLGIIYDNIGDYLTAQKYVEQSYEISRETGSEKDKVKAIIVLGQLCHHQGNDSVAIEYCQQALALTQELKARDAEACAATRLAHALLALGQSAEAAEHYQRSLALRRELGQQHLVPEPLAGLARIHLAQGNLSQAQELVEQILTSLESRSLEGTDEPISIYLICYRVLSANHDPRAAPILQTAHSMLQERAAKITDEALRRSYLENVAAHHELIQLVEDSTKRAPG